MTKQWQWAVLCAFVLGCGGSQKPAEEPGPMEKAGAKTDQAAEDAKESADEAADKAGEKVEKAGKKMQDDDKKDDK